MSSKLVPELRFKEFSGEWEEKKLGEVCEICNGGTPNTSNTSYWNGNINWITPAEMGKNKYVFDTNRKITEIGLKNCNTKLLSKNSIILSCRAPIGYVAINRTDMSFNQGCKGIVSKKLYYEFLYYLLIISKNKLENLGSGNTFKELSTNNLKKLKILIPPTPEEQQKIADTLSSLDNLIEAQTKKVELLKSHKKGLMQKLFPRDGAKVPEVRFKEFGGEWRKIEIKDIFKITRGEVLSMTLTKEKASEKFPYPVYSSQTKNNGLAGYFSDYLFENAITWTTDGANAGDVNYRKGKFYCTNVCGVLINNNGYANQFMAEILNTVTKKHVSYVGNPKLMNGVMAKISIYIPSLTEQQKIADTLSSLDNLIEAQNKKIEALKSHKKGLMQKMFVNKELEDE